MTDPNARELKLGPDQWIARALGDVASGWATLELHIDIIVWSLAGVSPFKGACITSQLPNVSRRLYALASLVDQYNPSEALRKKIAQYIDASNKLSRKRNRVIHDPWVHKGDTESPLAESYRVQVTAEMKLTFQFQPVSVKNLFDLAIEIEKHRGSLMELSNAIDSELGTSTASPANLFAHRPKDGDNHR